MKSYSRVEKRRRPSARGMDSRSQNFEDIVEKQLNDDFKVHEYLNENPPDGKNTEQYIALFNKLLVKKMNKNKRKKLLESSKAQFKSKTNNPSSEGEEIGGNNIVDFYYSEEEYQAIKQESEMQQEIIETKTEEELEMKKILWKEITEKKKSLNLLKGDIGHMIARNQSITVLESKVSKVSMVSENQLKRVSMALSKDWEEVDQRQDMQKKFHHKLKVIESAEKKNLKKIKNSYIQAMKRKKQIHDKLGQIESECASVDEYTDKQRQYKQKNITTIQVYELLGSLCDLIKKSNIYWEGFKNKEYDLKDYSQKLKAQFQSLFSLQKQKQKTNRSRYRSNTPIIMKVGSKTSRGIDSVDEIQADKLEIFKKTILEEYEVLTTQIFEKKKIYNVLMESLEQLWQKISVLDLKQSSLYENFNEEERIQLSGPVFSFSQYFANVKKLEQNIRAITLLLSFLKKKIHNFDSHGLNLMSRLYQNCLFHQRIFQKMEKTEGEIIKKREGQKFLNQSIPNFSCNIFEVISSNMKNWFTQLKDKKTLTSQQKIRVQRPKIQKNQDESLVETAKVLIMDSDEEQEDIENEKNNYKNSELTPTRANYSHHALNSSHENSFSKSRIMNYEKKNPQQLEAKRVLLLENIDQTYYKMIKQTLEMEKQNTRKNYEFQKNFKRTKYSSQDQLLEEKRFQATFSNLFKQTQEEKIKVYGKTEGTESKVFKPSNFSKTAPSKKKLVNSLYVDKSKTPKEKLILSKGKIEKVKTSQNCSVVLPKTPKKVAYNSHVQTFHSRPQTSSLINRSEKKKLSEKLRLFLHQI